jgi:DNA polymerase III subunit delta'
MNCNRGNELVQERLKKLVESNRVPHLLLFSGPDGVGKKRIARSFGAWWLSSLAKKTIPESHLDISCITPEGKTGMHSIASIRRCQDELYITPFEAPGKVLIIDDAERMLPVSANTLLKTLEEPPKNCLIILISSAKERILQTIMSRAQEVRFAPCSDEEVADFLEKERGMTPLQSKQIAHLARGSFGEAVRLCEKEQDELQMAYFEFLNSFAWLDFCEVTQLASKFHKKLEAKKKEKEELMWEGMKEAVKEFSAQQKNLVQQEIEGALSLFWMQEVRGIFHMALCYFRDLEVLQSMLASGDETVSLYFSDKKQELERALACGKRVSFESIEPLIQKAMHSLERSTPFQQVFESFFVRLSLQVS